MPPEPGLELGVTVMLKIWLAQAWLKVSAAEPLGAMELPPPHSMKRPPAAPHSPARRGSARRRTPPG